MRTVRGLEEAVKLLTQNRGLHLETLGTGKTPTAVAEEILGRVREGGDAAVRDITREIEGVELTGLEVPHSAIADARASVSREVADALRLAAERIRALPRVEHAPGLARSGQRLRRAICAGLPRGRVRAGRPARYPSTVLMTVIPARVAGVDEVIVATPGGDSGYPDPVVLAAAGRGRRGQGLPHRGRSGHSRHGLRHGDGAQGGPRVRPR